MSLKMKYFVLKPKSKFKGDPYAKAAREAMLAYAYAIINKDPELYDSLLMWASDEESNEELLISKDEEIFLKDIEHKLTPPSER